MLLGDLNGAQLTYCTNVHPGETLAELRALVKQHVTAVKRAVVPEGRFGVGLRVAAEAARALDVPEELARFRDELEAEGLYCFTINGFPYGAFHGTRVKEGVYLPDWRDPERIRYTQSLSRVLAGLLPPGVSGSISTVPGCFKPNAGAADAERRMAASLVDVAATLIEIERSSGRYIALALEPEPHCFLETTAEAVRFFERRLLNREACQRLCQVADVEPAEAERALRRHLGVCLDTCHASVEFEAPLDAWKTLQSAGIGVPKIQLSAGLLVSEATEEHLRALSAFENDVYLHQTVIRRGGALERFLDLPQALASEHAASGEWRVHFHVPIFLSELGLFRSTQADLLPLLHELSRTADCPHLEVETYTWDVLPPAFRDVPVEEAVARELRFVLDRLRAPLTAGSA